MNKDLMDIEVAEALASLIKRYPGQRVRISIEVKPNEPPIFFAGCEHLTSPSDYQNEMGKSAHEAVEKLVASVGDHNQFDARKAKVKQLEEELANLRRGLQSIGAVAVGDNESARNDEPYGHH